MPEDYSQGWITLGSVADFDVAEFIRTVHSLSSAQGAGFLNDKAGLLPDSEIPPYLQRLASEGRIRMDYIAGRSIKMSIHIHEDHYLIRDGAWYDHGDGEFNELLARFGITRGTEQKHSSHCQCDDCKPDHPIRDPKQALELCSITDIAYREPEGAVELKNGSTEAKCLVATVVMTIERLMKENSIALYEMAMLCRDSNHVPWGNSGEALKENKLAVCDSDGKWTVDPSIRNIVLSAVRGDGADMVVGSPVKLSPKCEDGQFHI